jgi:hypothetical protein
MAFSSKGDKSEYGSVTTLADAHHFRGFLPRRYVSGFIPQLFPVHLSPFLPRVSDALSSTRPVQSSISVTSSCLLRHFVVLPLVTSVRESKSPGLWNCLMSSVTSRRDGRYSTSLSFIPLLGSKLTPRRIPLQQISRLYCLLSRSISSLGFDSGEEDESVTQPLPLHDKPDTSPSVLFLYNNNIKGTARAATASLTLADIWDKQEELLDRQ